MFCSSNRRYGGDKRRVYLKSPRERLLRIDFKNKIFIIFEYFF